MWMPLRTQSVCLMDIFSKRKEIQKYYRVTYSVPMCEAFVESIDEKTT